MTAFTLIEAFNPPHLQQLFDLFKKMWWSEGRTDEDFITLLNNSLSIGIIETQNQLLVGYARVLTDEVKYAYIFDVMVEEKYRQQGLGRLLMETILTHPKLDRIVNFELTCLPEMMPFYQQFNFRQDFGKVVAMRYRRSNIA
ncbi:MAG: GNAT family N-acetyltransferase [Gammaproteobacteria bacterium]|nr:GNAT family N-acetyltransferase [Gammaproteobacteria bacterium]